MNQSPLETFQCTYYQKHPRGYKVIPRRRVWLFTLSVFFGVPTVGLGYVIYSYFPDIPSNFEMIVMLIILFLMTFFSLAQLTKKVIIDLSERAVKVYYFGFMVSKNLFDDFIALITSREYIKRLYVGTQVIMVFKKRKVVIGISRDSSVVSGLMGETKFLIQSKGLVH